MSEGINIGLKDVLWNYAATFLKVGVGVILLPFILHAFPKETVAIWAIYSTVITMITLLDFGFNPSFARNVSYVVSGVKELRHSGYQTVENRNNSSIDYSLFKGLINAMRWFYTRMALLLFLLLATAGTYYIHLLMKTYTGNHTEVYISWFILCTINTYSLYTFYYDALMQGMGLIKRAKQILIIGEILYLMVSVLLIVLHFDLIAIVSAQAVSIIIRRTLSRKTVYTVAFKIALNNVVARAKKECIKPILPNALKLGLTGVGNFLVRRSPLIIGSLFLPLSDIASYGITIQIVWIITEIANVYMTTYYPQIVQYRIQNNIPAIRRSYLRSCSLMLLIFIICGTTLVFLGDWALQVIKSETPLCSKALIVGALFVYLLERNQFLATDILLTKNEVPFFYASLFSGAFTFILLIIFLTATSLGIWGLILAQGIAQSVYSNWRWPIAVFRSFRVNKIVVQE
ncbi:MAG: hypothetical protein LBH04_02705 [Tannerellaceae bacterium]|nr:hypothetical protein [Tannerellaceae bacterium]